MMMFIGRYGGGGGKDNKLNTAMMTTMTTQSERAFTPKPRTRYVFSTMYSSMRRPQSRPHTTLSTDPYDGRDIDIGAYANADRQKKNPILFVTWRA